MKAFMDKDFLLSTDTAKELYAACKDEPIFDWHCHLSPKEIWEDKTPRDLTELLLGGDHYKWSLMRNYGVAEELITGGADPYDKFAAFAEALSAAVGNPIYHWTHLELKTYFGIETPLSPKTAKEIWDKANAVIAGGGMSPRSLIKNSGVVALCTTDDPADSLEYHKLIAGDESFDVKVVPAFRPDKALACGAKTFMPWLAAMEYETGDKITTYAELKKVLVKRMDFFMAMGTVATDHAFLSAPFRRAEENELEEIFTKAKKGAALTDCEIEKYQTELIRFLASEYKKRGWVMELHIGALRNNNTALFAELGPDTGFDIPDDGSNIRKLAALLDSMYRDGALPKTVLFPLDPAENLSFEAVTRCFQDPGARGWVQTGAAWWYNDHINGIRAMLKNKCDVGVLGTFVGMVTDSRSFLSYTRHDYFRRILCDLVGNIVENGEYPADLETLSGLVRGVSFRNAEVYFGL
ncbi:MAG: glucuronate isomerase [Clostridia bacterium]|nr:glucuronate isomerase [Clostridia bacterium]